MECKYNWLIPLALDFGWIVHASNGAAVLDFLTLHPYLAGCMRETIVSPWHHMATTPHMTFQASTWFHESKLFKDGILYGVIDLLKHPVENSKPLNHGWAIAINVEIIPGEQYPDIESDKVSARLQVPQLAIAVYWDWTFRMRGVLEGSSPVHKAIDVIHVCLMWAPERLIWPKTIFNSHSKWNTTAVNNSLLW